MNVKHLKELFSDQCSPCIGCTTEGDVEKAKVWKCQKFVNGFFIMEVK